MREPKLHELTIDKAATAKIRASLAREKAVTITITVDAKSLHGLKTAAKRTGVPYPALVRRALQSGLRRQVTTESRLDQLERDVKRMKRILVA